MKKLIFLIFFLLFAVISPAQIRISQIQGDTSGAPTLKTELKNRDTRAVADGRYFLVSNGVSAFSTVPRVYTSNVQHQHTGNTSATVVYTLTIPAGTVGPNGKIEVDCLWSCNNSVGTKTCAIKLGSSTLISTALAAHLSASYWAAMRCRNSLTSQISYSNGVLAQQGASVAALQNYTLNFGGDVVLTAVITLQTGTDNAALEAITVKTWY